PAFTEPGPISISVGSELRFRRGNSSVFESFEARPPRPPTRDGSPGRPATNHVFWSHGESPSEVRPAIRGKATAPGAQAGRPGWARHGEGSQSLAKSGRCFWALDRHLARNGDGGRCPRSKGRWCMVPTLRDLGFATSCH